MNSLFCRRTFLKSILVLGAFSFLRPRIARAQVIPFAFWKSQNNSLWIWGVNTYGQLGTGNTTSYSSPVQVPGSWNQVSSAWTWKTTGNATDAFSMGIKTVGTGWAWGNNNYGQLGLGNTTAYSSPVQLAGSWNQLSCGGQGWDNLFSLGIRSNQTLWAWGDGSFGQLGQNSTTSYSSPVQVGALSWSSVSAGYAQWLGIQTNGTLWACGSTWAGEIPSGPQPGAYSSPVQIAGSWSQAFVTVDSSAGGYAGGIKTDGTLWMWGGNGNGDLGNNNANVAFSSPVQIAGSWTQLSICSSSFTAAIRSDNTLWTWGANSNGQLGNGTTTDSAVPIQVPGTWKYVCVTSSNSGTGGCTHAIRSDGSRWAWGDNSSGLYGNGTTSSVSSPIQIASGHWSFVGGGPNTVMLK